MALMLPAGFRDIAADTKHPWYRPEAHDPNLVIFLNGEPLATHYSIVEASETNGFIKIIKIGRDGEVYQHPYRKRQLATVRIKGKVQIFFRKETA